MRRDGLLAVALLLGGCRQLLGLDDPGATHDALVNDQAGDDAPVDGSPDASIVCPDPLRDYDADGISDCDDPCPHLATGNVDTDGDGVGDLCDPRPNMSGDRRVVWNGFYKNADIAPWIVDGGTWAIANGGGVVQSNATEPNAALAAPGTVLHAYVATSFDVEALDFFGSSAGVCGQYVSGPSSVCCYIQTEPATATVGVAEAMGATTSMTWSGSYGVGSRVDVLQMTLADNGCTFAQMTNIVSVSHAYIAEDGRIQLFTSGASVRFRYVFGVDIGN